jgi:hypothetical protein
MGPNRNYIWFRLHTALQTVPQTEKRCQRLRRCAAGAFVRVNNVNCERAGFSVVTLCVCVCACVRVCVRREFFFLVVQDLAHSIT